MSSQGPRIGFGGSKISTVRGRSLFPRRVHSSLGQPHPRCAWHWPTDDSAVGIGVAVTAIAALEGGNIQAAGLGRGDHFLLLQRHPGARILADMTTLEGMRKNSGSDTFAGGTLSARQEWLDRNPDTARRLDRAVLRAQKNGCPKGSAPRTRPSISPSSTPRSAISTPPPAKCSPELPSC